MTENASFHFVEWNRSLLAKTGDPRLTGDAGWCSLIHALHEGLADPTSRPYFPRYRRNQEHVEATTYWETAVHVLYLLLGWRDAGAGLQAWYRSGKKVDGDRRLEILKEVFDSEGQLDALALHLWEHRDFQHETVLASAAEIAGVAPHALREGRRGEDFADSEWIKSVRARYPPDSGTPDPYNGGTNALHLGHSADGSGTQVAELHVMHAVRRAVLVLERGLGWYRALASRGGELPSLDGESWRVDVVVRPMGWLGTFRRSRSTGLWFQGRHSIHMMGN